MAEIPSDGGMLSLPLMAVVLLTGSTMFMKRTLNVSLLTSLACSLRLSAILGLHAIDLLRKSRCSSIRAWCPGLRRGGDRKIRMWDQHKSILNRSSLHDEMMWQQVNNFSRIMHFLTQSPKEAVLYGGAKLLTSALLSWLREGRGWRGARNLLIYELIPLLKRNETRADTIATMTANETATTGQLLSASPCAR